MKLLSEDHRRGVKLYETERGYSVIQETEFYTVRHIIERKGRPSRDMRKHDLLDAEKMYDKLCGI